MQFIIIHGSLSEEESVWIRFSITSPFLSVIII